MTGAAYAYDELPAADRAPVSDEGELAAALPALPDEERKSPSPLYTARSEHSWSSRPAGRRSMDCCNPRKRNDIASYSPSLSSGVKLTALIGAYQPIQRRGTR